MSAGTARRLRRGVSDRPPQIEPRVHGFSSPEQLRGEPVWLEYKKDVRHGGAAQPHSPKASRNCTAVSTGDHARMGHCDSPAQFGGHGGFPGSGRGVAAAYSSRNDSCASESAIESETIASTGNGRTAAGWALLALLRIYKVFLSPFFGGACKYYPSCSNYAYEAIERHGARRGTALALKRLLRCRPFVKGGYDPIPDTLETKSALSAAASEEPV